jgi:hypothetical protein
VARVLTLFGATIDCAQAPGCVIGAVDLGAQTGSLVATAPLSFDPSVKPLPPLTLVVHVKGTGQIVAGAHGPTGPRSKRRSAVTGQRPFPSRSPCRVIQPAGSTQAGGEIEAVTSRQRAVTTFTQSGHRLRVPQLQERPDPGFALRRQAQLTSAGLDRCPMRLWTPPECEEPLCWQSQRDSNPCRHLESVIKHVQQVRLRAVLTGQEVYVVQPVRPVRPNLGEKMDNRMDNGSIFTSKVIAVATVCSVRRR